MATSRCWRTAPTTPSRGAPSCPFVLQSQHGACHAGCQCGRHGKPRSSGSGYLSRSLIPRALAHSTVSSGTLLNNTLPLESRTSCGSGAISPRRAVPHETEHSYLKHRTENVTRYFPNALGIDDFMQRVEIALYAYGFSGDNTIAMVNLCRDEVTMTLKQKIDQVFGSSFNTNGLGGVLTCGVSGVRAGLSHAPVCKTSGKERYVFFSFPHVSVDARGVQGSISRPGRPEASCACGALKGALLDIQRTGLGPACKVPGVHDPLDPEMTILKQRLARRLRHEGADEDGIRALDLVGLTKVAERTITDDLEYLISQTVDPTRNDYAIVTGVQIHSWSACFDDEVPNLEFVAPTTIDVVTCGVKTHIDLLSLPSLTPRQISILAGDHDGRHGQGSHAGHGASVSSRVVCDNTGATTVREIEAPYMYTSAVQKASRLARIADYTQAAHYGEEEFAWESCPWPSWQARLRAKEAHRADDSSLHIDHSMT